MNRLHRTLTAFTLLLSLSLTGIFPLASVTPVSAATPQHTGRLGGSQATFKTRFGVGEGTTATRSGITYVAGPYRSIVVKFDGDRAVDIMVTPSGDDWTEAQAKSVARSFLPKDVKSDYTQHNTGDGRFEVACASNDLGAQFTKSDYKRLKHAGDAGDCFYLLSPSSASTVHQVELSIGRAGSLDRPEPTPTPEPPTATPEPTTTPDNSTFIGGDGCTYRNADGAQVSCPVGQAPADTSGDSSSGSGGDAVAPGGGATALCQDGTYSYAAHHQGACSHHGGVAEFYK